MKKKISFYFVIYLVVLVELLAVIVERDENEHEIKQKLLEYETIQDSLVALYKKPLKLLSPSNSNFILGNKGTSSIQIPLSELQTDKEKRNVKYLLKSNEDIVKITSIETDYLTGNCIINFQPLKAGSENVTIYAEVKRELPDYLPELIVDGVIEKMGDKINSRTDTLEFKINVTSPTRNLDKPGRN